MKTQWQLAKIYFLPPAGVALACWMAGILLHPGAIYPAVILSFLALFGGYHCIATGKAPWEK